MTNASDLPQKNISRGCLFHNHISNGNSVYHHWESDILKELGYKIKLENKCFLLQISKEIPVENEGQLRGFYPHQWPAAFCHIHPK